MITRIQLLLLGSLLIFGCKCHQVKKNIPVTTVVSTQVPNPEISKQEEPVFEPFQNNEDSFMVTSKKQIMGNWEALNGNENLTMQISKDSIYYVEHAEYHKYAIHKDSLFIYYPDYSVSGKPILLKDTLAIVSESEISKFTRIKN